MRVTADCPPGHGAPGCPHTLEERLSDPRLGLRERIGRRVAPWFDHIPVNDWDWLNDRLATGAMPLTRREMDRLVEAGITHVVSLCTEAPLTMQQIIVSDRRITHLLNASPDDGMWKDARWFERTLTFARAALADGGKVYVHCLAGSNRGPAHAYLVLRAMGYPATVAEAMVRKARPKARLLYLPDAEAAWKALT